ncbi:MAG: hypothetical protein PHD13_05530 [Methanocellales archaeon]|nr:hypothetical protein [Methanocellales archaeon]MDD5485738.1 hypothetical protein [Methanocellales archaeon]
MKKAVTIVLFLALVTCAFSGCVENEFTPTSTPTPRAEVGPIPTSAPTTVTVVGAGLVEKLTLEQLTAKADFILVGTVTNIVTQRDTEDKSIHILVSISIEQSIKGNLGQRITITVPGGELEGAKELVEDTPSFRVSERVLVFLHQEDVDTFSVVGGFQGKFSIYGGNMVSGNTSQTEFIDQIKNIMAK